jgi:uncharacterized protein (TIGR02147 family)
MVNVFQFSDCHAYLAAEFRARTIRNSKYSLRAFSRDLGVNLARLSEVLSQKRNLSMGSALAIMNSTKMNVVEKEYFKNLVLCKSSRSPRIRKEAQDEIRRLSVRRAPKKLNSGIDILLSRWYLIPLMELLTFSSNISLKKIGEFLGISELETKLAIKKLESLKYLTKDSKEKKWVATDAFFRVESQIPSHVIREYHKNILQLAMAAILKQPVENRKILSSVMSIKKSNLQEMRKDLEEFNSKMLEKYMLEVGGDSVYVMGLQLFQLDWSNGE